MGHKEESGSVEVENRRRTRSSTRGVLPTAPPPAKREKKTPPSGGRGELHVSVIQQLCGYILHEWWHKKIKKFSFLRVIKQLVGVGIEIIS